ncbi:hypothetical protein [Kallipyga massiliensis]|uniref:hypothetical protein n=1 Tax=Kallipyga massiliensis TaxID=1472764 RepID=UPI0026F1F416|nr:hypothetical protein [Kallipyga massiliensis]
MNLNQKTLEELRKIINGDNTDHYRSGPELVRFFNQLGFSDKYSQGFPSRWAYTDEKLSLINRTSTLDQCVKNTFAVNQFIENIDYLDELIDEFNCYLAFDKWQILRDNDQIYLKKQDKVVIKSPSRPEKLFLENEIKFDLEKVGLNPEIEEIIRKRILEVEQCIKHDAPLAAIFLIGSSLEGVLLGVSAQYPRQFNCAQTAPKFQGKVKPFQDWNLHDLINVAFEIGALREDVKQFSHTLRDFRNYIHPYEQLVSHFTPDVHTVLICRQVLRAAISQISEFRKNN